MNTYVQNAWFVKPSNRHSKGHNWTPQKQLSRTWACRFPDAIAGAYSEALRAVGAVVAASVGSTGWCEKSEAEIADIAGCSITTVQNFLYWGTQTRHIQVIRRPVFDRFGNRLNRNLTNKVRIISTLWLKFLRWCASAGGGFKNSRSSKKEDTFFLRPSDNMSQNRTTGSYHRQEYKSTPPP